ncbi:MAG: hypothetical protein Q7T83_12520 [Thermodesulfovibrionales bacterium]|nr:hypothetical protein [Thermodesulfovibrionales bacterium]MDP3111017.1 hypothetical protein [Thermodesulfovibrionales bacterium]
MSFNWKLYVDLSNELISHQRTPSLKDAYLRSAISRSYYGVFCIAREPLIYETVYDSKVESHKEVREHYNSAVTRKERQIGTKLSRLWAERKAADYDTDATFDDERARTAHKMAVDTITLLEELSTPKKK